MRAGRLALGALSLLVGARAQQAVQQDFALVPEPVLAACNASTQCNNFILERLCVLDSDLRTPSLTLTPSNGTIFVGVVVDLNPLFGIQLATTCAMDLFQLMGGAPNDTVIEPVYILANDTDKDATARGMQCLHALGDDVSVVAGPHRDTGIVPVLSLSNIFKIGVFASMVTSASLGDASFETGYPLAARTGFDNFAAVRVNMDFAAFLGVRKYALLVVGSDEFQRTIFNSARSLEAQFNMTRVITEGLPPKSDSVTVKRVLAQIRNSGARAILYMLDTAFVRTEFAVPLAAADLGMLGTGFQWFGHVWGAFVRNVLPDNQAGIFASIGTVDSGSEYLVPFRACLAQPNAEDPRFADLGAIDRPDGNISPEAIVFDSAISMLHFALKQADLGLRKLRDQDFRSIIGQISFRGPTGFVSFDGNFDRRYQTAIMLNTLPGSNRAPVAKWSTDQMILLRQPSELVFGGGASELPADFAMDCANPDVYTITVSDCDPLRTVNKVLNPGDGEKYCPSVDPYEIACDYIYAPGNVGAIIINLVGVCTTALFAAFLIKTWNHPMCRSGQRHWLLCMCVGALLAQLTFPFAIVGRQTTQSCALKRVIVSIGAVLVLSAVIVKLWRLNRIFHSQGVSTKGVSNSALAKQVFALLLVAIALIALSLLVSPPKVQTTYFFTDQGDRVGWRECGSTDAWPFYLLSGFIALLAIYACFLANEARQLSSALSEGPYVFLAVYNATLSAAVVWIFTKTSHDSRAEAIVISLGFFLASTGTVVLILFKRFYVILTQPMDTDWTRFILEQMSGAPKSVPGNASNMSTGSRSSHVAISSVAR